MFIFLGKASYQAADGAITAGLGLRLNLDSAKLIFNALSYVLADEKASEQYPIDDLQDFDSATSSDQFILLSLTSFAANWLAAIRKTA